MKTPLPVLMDKSFGAAGLPTRRFSAILLLLSWAAMAGGQTQAPNTPLNLTGPHALTVDAAGSVYVSTAEGVLRIDDSGTPTRIAPFDSESGRFYRAGGRNRVAADPRAVALDGAGNLYIADPENDRILRVNIATGAISTVAGNGSRGFSGDGGPGVNAQLNGPSGLALDAAGNLFIADGASRIRRVAVTSGVITTVAGVGSQGYSGDGGPATKAQFRSVGGLATDASGNLYIADNYNHRIRMVSAATGVITTVAGTGVAGYAGDGGSAVSAELQNPLSVVVDVAGNLYIADSGNFRVRKVNIATGAISTLAATSLAYTDAQHGYPCSLALDAAGNLYVADSGTSRIRKISLAAVTETVGGPAARAAAAGSLVFNVTYDASVPAPAQTAFNNLISTYQNLFTNKLTFNVNVNFGVTGLAQSSGFRIPVTYASWRAAMLAAASVNPGNKYLVAAAASLPAADPIGQGHVILLPANARILGFSTTNTVDTTLTFSNAPNTWEYNGISNRNLFDFLDAAAHEIDEALGVDSAIRSGPLPADNYSAEDYFRYTAPGARLITNTPIANVYFSWDGGATDVARFNQDPAGGDINDWIYGNNGCPATSPGPYIQDAGGCPGDALPLGQAGSPEVIVLSSLGYTPATPTAAPVAQTITFATLPSLTLGSAPFVVTATASSGLTVTFASTTPPVCSVSGTVVAILAGGTCSITASQAGNANFLPAVNVVQSFTVTVSASAPPVITGVAPACSRATTIQPGEWVSIYGSNLTRGIANWNSDFPTSLGGTNVTIDGKAAYLSYAGPGQINLQAPDDTTMGTVQVSVTTAGGSAVSTVTLAAFAPCFALLDAKHVAGIIFRTNGSGAYFGGAYDIVGPTGTSLGYATVAAKAGDIVELFGTGFGPTNPAVVAGQAFSGRAQTTSSVNLLINNASVTPFFAGLSGAGLDQLNLTIPSGLGAGDMPLQAVISGVTTLAGVVISLQ